MLFSRKGGIRLIDEDVSRRTIAVSIKATKLTGRVLAQACLAVGRKMRFKNMSLAQEFISASSVSGIYVLGDLVWWGAKSFLYVFGASTLFSSFIYLFPVCAAFPYAL